jgi:predicted nuclease of predicted toxin-antitoxin system
MARLLADEHFDVAVVRWLRKLGHNTETVRQHSRQKGGDGMEDDEVLRIGNGQKRIVITENVADFKALHNARIPHAGIIACSQSNGEPPKERAKRIEAMIKSRGRSTKMQWIAAALMERIEPASPWIVKVRMPFRDYEQTARPLSISDSGPRLGGAAAL